WALGFGLWALGFGLWALGFGLWALGFGLKSMLLKTSSTTNNKAESHWLFNTNPLNSSRCG
ncbi:hypothetical protein ABN239_12425, partial [Providencia vermicola]